jgi:HEAT repeat protein
MKTGALSSLLFALAFFAAVASAADEKHRSDIPPRQQWIAVDEVSQEYDHVRKERCKCGGSFKVVRQSTGVDGGLHYDRLFCRCRHCGGERTFTFDVTSIFRKEELAQSQDARSKAYAELDRRYPKVSLQHISKLKALLGDDNPHYRMWAAKRLGQLATAEADKVLLKAYLQAGLIEGMPLEEALQNRGAAVLPLLKDRLAAADRDEGFKLADLLSKIRDPGSARMIESRLRKDLESGNTDIRRVCYIGLGELGDKGSEPLLLEAERAEAPRPDDALLWALGCCGTKKSFPALRKYLKSEEEVLRLAAIAGLGLAGDQESTAAAIETARTAKNFYARFNAVYALGRLRAKQAVPLLIELLQPTPKYGAFCCPQGIYGKDGMYTNDANVDVCLRALGRIRDRRALPEFERILKNDGYYLDHEVVAQVAAELGWRELVPAIVDRLEKDYQHNVELLGKDQQRYSPALRKLTGQKFGENPKAWRQWQKGASGRKPPAAKDRPKS